jgi:hypothetical protein
MPTNEYYDSTGAPSYHSPGSSAAIRSELDAIEAGFVKLPTMTAHGGELVVVNAAGTKQETKTVTAALSGVGVEMQANKDTSDGYVGLTGYGINIKNASGLYTAVLSQVNTAIRSYVLPNKSGTFAMTTDITGTNSGTNTGDQDLSGLVPKTTTVNGHALSSSVTVTKADVNLENCDNTSDANKPVSTATQTALNLKANAANAALTGVPIAPTAALGTDTDQLATTAFVQNALPTSGLRSRIIDGDFNIWEEATTQTTAGYGSDTMWRNWHNGTTKVHSRQAFTLGQTDVPGNPKYYSRTVVTSVAGASNACIKTQKIEGVETFSGKTVTVSFYAKADAAKNIAIQFYQSFGTGGSPSADVSGIGSQKIALTTSWAKYEATVAIPSISGKTLGTNNNDYLEFWFFFDAGSNYNPQSATLGQQSGTFEIARVRLVSGSDSGNDIDEVLMEQFSESLRYYFSSKCSTGGPYAIFAEEYNITGRYNYQNFILPVKMRAVPSGTIVGTWLVYNCSQPNLNVTDKSVSLTSITTTTGLSYYVCDGSTQYFTLDARL